MSGDALNYNKRERKKDRNRKRKIAPSITETATTTTKLHSLESHINCVLLLLSVVPLIPSPCRVAFFLSFFLFYAEKSWGNCSAPSREAKMCVILFWLLISVLQFCNNLLNVIMYPIHSTTDSWKICRIQLWNEKSRSCVTHATKKRKQQKWRREKLHIFLCCIVKISGNSRARVAFSFSYGC